MQLIYDPFFVQEMIALLDVIAKDSPTCADAFENELRERLANLAHFPYKFRRSIHHDDEQIRDYIFKGYTIPYLVDEEKDQLVVLDIFKWQDR